MNYNQTFSQSIAEVKNEGRYRIFTDLDFTNSAPPVGYSKRFGREITVWCSNDYLGMSQNEKVKNAAAQALMTHGVGSGGTRNISGTNNLIVDLEGEIADLHSTESALLFTSGYVANQATISTMTKIFPNIVMFSDELNHASMIHGIRDSRCEKVVFEHSNLADLEEKLASYPIDTPKLILFESVYSMQGDISPIREIVALAKKYNALTYLDEVHSVGLYGDRGAGVANMLGVESEIDIMQGTLAKAYGVIGGYIAGKADIIDAIRSHAPGFIFTTSLPPTVTAAAKASIEHLKSSNDERRKMHENVKYVVDKLDGYDIKYFKNTTHIVPVFIGDPNIAREISEELLRDYGLYIQHINYPTVPKGTERLRITPTPLHTKEMADFLCDSLAKVIKKYTLPSFSQEDTIAA